MHNMPMEIRRDSFEIGIYTLVYSDDTTFQAVRVEDISKERDGITSHIVVGVLAL